MNTAMGTMASNADVVRTRSATACRQRHDHLNSQLVQGACSLWRVEKFKKVTPPPLDLGVSGRTRGGGARVRQLEGVDQHLDFVRCVFNPETVKQAREASVTRRLWHSHARIRRSSFYMPT